MRAPFQILAIPYRVTPELQFCVFHRADIDQYQFVAGGGENDEKPVDAAIREICEETSINTDTRQQCKLSLFGIHPLHTAFSAVVLFHWPHTQRQLAHPCPFPDGRVCE